MKNFHAVSFLFSLPFAGRIKTALSKFYAKQAIRPTENEKHSHNESKKILLTFDDLADEPRIKHILAILKEKNVRAIFFLIGEWAEQNANLIELIRNAGHTIGNHSYSHKKLTSLSDDEVRAEISRGVQSKLLRPPYGAYDDRIRKIASELGYGICYWSIDSDDWRGLSAKQINERVLSELHPGACVLLHLNGPCTEEALPLLIDGIRAKGYEV